MALIILQYVKAIMGTCLNFQQLAVLEKRAKPFLWLSDDWGELTLDENSLSFHHFKVLVLDAFSHFGYHIFHPDFFHFFLEEVKKQTHFPCLHMRDTWRENQWKKQTKGAGEESEEALVNFYLLISYRLLSVPQGCFPSVGLSWMSEDTIELIRRGETERLPTILGFTINECLSMVHQDYSLKYQLALLAFATYSKKTKHQTILRIDINEAGKNKNFVKLCLQTLEIMYLSPSSSLPMTCTKLSAKLSLSGHHFSNEEILRSCLWLTEAGFLWRLGKKNSFDLCEKAKMYARLYFTDKHPTLLNKA